MQIFSFLKGYMSDQSSILVRQNRNVVTLGRLSLLYLPVYKLNLCIGRVKRFLGKLSLHILEFYLGYSGYNYEKSQQEVYY